MKRMPTSPLSRWGAVWLALACIGAALTLTTVTAAETTAAPTTRDAGAPPEVLHMPAQERHAEQGILRPVPIAQDLPEGVALRARRVLVHYRLWGEPDWTTLELRRNGVRYEGAIPCLEVSTVTGDLKYYLRVHDAEGQIIATAASLASPYRVTIHHDTTLTSTEAHPAKCPDPDDCPAGLPGCPSEKVVDIPCNTDRDCDGGMTCGWNGYCERTERGLSQVSASVEQDFGVVSRAGACSIYSQENEGTACIRSDGQQYVGNAFPQNDGPGAGTGPTRVVLGYDRVLYYDTTLGVRVGWAFLGEGATSRGGSAFFPVSFSARVAHWFGEDPFAHAGFRSFVFLTGGYGMFDIQAPMRVREDPTEPPYQGGNDLEQDVTLWKRAGDGFVGGGAGIAWAVSPGLAFVLDASLLGTFPFGAWVVAPSVGVVVGF